MQEKRAQQAHPCHSWRDYLEAFPESEQQRLCESLGITKRTWQRWIHEGTFPRLAHVQHLLSILPREQRLRFGELLKADPHFIPYAEQITMDRSQLDIPSESYAQFIKALLTTPRDIYRSMLCQIALQGIHRLLDPDHDGLSLIVLVCSQPHAGRVRYLHSLLATHALPGEHPTISQKRILRGSESVAGAAISAGRIIARETTDPKNRYQVAVPIMGHNSIAGALAARSPHPFTESALSILEQYSNLFAVTFLLSGEAWYSQDRLALDDFSEA